MRGVWISSVVVFGGCDLVFGLDRPSTEIPTVVEVANTYELASTSLEFPMTIPSSNDRLLLVSVGVSMACPDDTQIFVESVTYGVTPLDRVSEIVGTTCRSGDVSGTRSEQWKLIAPAVGTANVVVRLSTFSASLHVGAVAFAGVDQRDPVRDSTSLSGRGTFATSTVGSEVGDLVISTVGQGDFIVEPGAGQAELFIGNVSNESSLGNSAASTAPGLPTSTPMDWTFRVTDSWQMILTSLTPS